MNWIKRAQSQFCKSQRSRSKSCSSRWKAPVILIKASSIQKLVIILSIQKYSKTYNNCLGRTAWPTLWNRTRVTYSEFTTNKSRACDQTRQIQQKWYSAETTNWIKRARSQFCKSQRSRSKSCSSRWKAPVILIKASSIQKLVIILSIQKYSKTYNNCLGRREYCRRRARPSSEASCLEPTVAHT